jgi:hypothetical protein
MKSAEISPAIIISKQRKLNTAIVRQTTSYVGDTAGDCIEVNPGDGRSVDPKNHRTQMFNALVWRKGLPSAAREDPDELPRQPATMPKTHGFGVENYLALPL